jgi:hypothetical protein
VPPGLVPLPRGVPRGRARQDEALRAIPYKAISGWSS